MPEKVPHAAVPGLAARAVAVESIIQVIKSRSSFEDIFETIKERVGHDERDRSLARAIATVSLRRYGSLKHIVESRLDQDKAVSLHLETILVVGAAQILHMDVPDRAAVDLAVRLVQQNKSLRGFSGLVNAVLRRVVRERDEIALHDDPLQDVPSWLLERWTTFYGSEAVLAIAQAHRAGASLDITVKSDVFEWAEKLNADVLTTGSLRLRDRTAIRELQGFEEGAWWVQDAAAALPAQFLLARPGERIADLCAAPGGKTAQLAATGAQILAVDRSAPRLKRLKENMQRLQLAVDVRVADVLAIKDKEFDAILLDAPCSATGTLRRNPEIAWTKTADDVRKLADLQRKLLDHSAGLLKPGGRMVYCTCSLEREEGEGQIEAFLERHPDFRRVPVTDQEVGLSLAITPSGDVRTLPSMLVGENLWGLDGFFAARLEKASEKESLN